MDLKKTLWIYIKIYIEVNNELLNLCGIDLKLIAKNVEIKFQHNVLNY